jgi:anthraniloyl-CoA monooxygenase
MSTWVIEAPDSTWTKAEPLLSTLNEQQTVAYLEKLWARRLNGHKLIANRSVWRRFPIIQNKNWYYKNIVLLGDALHTAHFSIGSGTKLAMEDAINLFNAFKPQDSVTSALERFQKTRRLDVEKTQYAANVSALWTENPGRGSTYLLITRRRRCLHRSRSETWW